MRAIYILLVIIIFIINGCASVEVAKELTKATKSIEVSIEKIKKKSKVKEDGGIEENIDKEKISEFKTDEEKEKEILLIEKKEIAQEKKEEGKVILKQKKVFVFNLYEKTLVDLEKIFGKPKLFRTDGNTILARYDSSKCRLFVFINMKTKKQKINYYELRNDKGGLIVKKENIENCFKEIKII